MITLRPHQITAIEDCDRLSQTYRNVMVVLPTGAGKSLTLAHYAQRYYQANEPTVIFAHRDVLISQLSEALCKMGVLHTFICSDKARRDITNNNLKKFGRTWYDKLSPIIVSSNPTFAARLKGCKLRPEFLSTIRHWIQDECHHVTQDSVLWGGCINSLPSADGKGFTATPIRGDKKGLGRGEPEYSIVDGVEVISGYDNDGLFDVMSVTTVMWELIQKGMLTPYKIFLSEKKPDLSSVTTAKGGDYNQTKLGDAVDKRAIIGDAVKEYKRVGHGQQAITFCVNIKHAQHVAQQFNDAGVPSRAVSSKTPFDERTRIMDDFEKGIIWNLVNVDLLGEGYDCPVLSIVIMLRPTKSYSLFKQQFGRALRPADGKPYGILLDHAGNTLFMMKEYGLEYPHDDPQWTLERGTKRAKSDDGTKPKEKQRCSNCAYLYTVETSVGLVCPECEHKETVEQQESKQREVQIEEGDLVEMSLDVMNSLLNERRKVDLTVEQFNNRNAGLTGVAKYSATNNHIKRQLAQTQLRDKIHKWCVKYGNETGYSVDTVRREFEIVHGVNILKAQVLSSRQALDLVDRIKV